MKGTVFHTQRKSNFANFLLAEYSNIAQAHFKTLETISTFFQHYLTIVSIPIALTVLLVNLGKEALVDIVPKLSLFLTIFFFIVSFVGLFVLWYIVSLRLDALLYARTINGIRKYFHDVGEIDLEYKVSMRVLPQSPQIPPYREWHFFIPVVLLFALFDSVYFLIASLVSTGRVSFEQVDLGALYRIIVPSLVFFFAHPLIYVFLTWYRELGHLRSYIVGVDVDGVLNLQREHFCHFLKETVGKQISPDRITAIPVRECESLGVTLEDEEQVFNDPRYWIDMPVRERAPDVLRSLRNSFNLRLIIFTHRPWPTSKDTEAKNNWRREWGLFHQRVRGNKPWWTRLILWVRSLWRDEPLRIVRPWLWFRKDYIDLITKLWLEQHGFEYDKIMIEKGSEEVADPRGRILNRFFTSRAKKIRFFVEDDLVKAIKLAFICEIVFLIDQPYNQDAPMMPANIIRVKSWDEILRKTRTLI
ncbi:MAG: hypothetical protein QXI12_05420 [Candidatus Methanomethyliaceae archaeon]